MLGAVEESTVADPETDIIDGVELVNPETGVNEEAELVDPEAGIIERAELLDPETGVNEGAEFIDPETDVIERAELVDPETGINGEVDTGTVDVAKLVDPQRTGAAGATDLDVSDEIANTMEEKLVDTEGIVFTRETEFVATFGVVIEAAVHVESLIIRTDNGAASTTI